MKKLVALVLAAVMLLSLASAFGETITMWCIATESDANRPAYEAAIAAVEAANPGLEIKWEAFENQSYKTKIKTAMADPSTLPDIFFTWAGAFCGDFAQQGNVYCLEEAYKDYADALPAVMLQNASYDVGGSGKKPYAVPLTMNIVTLFANMDLLAKAGVRPLYSGIPISSTEASKEMVANPSMHFTSCITVQLRKLSGWAKSSLQIPLW